MDRRSLLKFGLVLTAGSPIALSAQSPTFAAENLPLSGNGEPFSFEWLRNHARMLSSQNHQPADNPLPAKLKALDWDQYQQIRYRPDQALWRNRDSAFQLQFFHLGLFFLEPVTFHEVIDGKARPIAYDPELFDYGDNTDLSDLPDDLGYAGFRLHFHQDFERDVAAFLGASYFRAVGESRQYGHAGQ